MKSNLFTATKGKWDPHNSTFKHIITLSNGKELIGYSKGSSVPEKIDKDTCLQSTVARLLKNGYLHPDSIGTTKETVSIDVMLNDPMDDALIVSFYPQDAVIYDVPDILDEDLLKSFVKRFYEQIKTGNRNNLVKDQKPKRLLDLRRVFETQEMLLEYMNELIHKYGIPRDVAKAYYEKKLRMMGNETA